MQFFPDDPPFAKITRNHWIEFLSYLTTDYVSDPDGVAPRGPMKLAPKTIFNIHTNLASLYSWAVKEGLVERNLIHTIDRPEFEKPVIVPLTRDEVEALLKACDKTRHWRTRNAINSTRYTAARDRSIIRLLLDTGIRAEELCSITFNDLNLHKLHYQTALPSANRFLRLQSRVAMRRPSRTFRKSATNMESYTLQSETIS